MKRSVLAFAVAAALTFVVGSSKAQACSCDILLQQLGSGTSDVVSPVNNTTSMAFWDDDCYVLDAPGRPPGEQDSTNWWRIHVRRSDTQQGTWVETNGGNPINFYDGKTTQPYFYEAQLVVFQDHLYAVFSESDGDGPNPGNGHKIVHVRRYDKATDTWTFVDQTSGYERLGLSYPYYPGPNYWHWAYRNFGGVVATANALYVTWSEFVDWGDGTSSSQLAIAKYDGSSWTYLPTTGLPAQPTYDGSGQPTSNGMLWASASLGEYGGALVMAYRYYRYNYADYVLRVAKFDASTQTWSNISGWLNVQTNSNASVGLLA